MKLQCMGGSAVVSNVVVCIATVILANYTVTVSTSFRMLPRGLSSPSTIMSPRRHSCPLVSKHSKGIYICMDVLRYDANSLRDDLLVAFRDHFLHSLRQAGSTGRCARVRLQVFCSVQDLPVVLLHGVKGPSRRPTRAIICHSSPTI